MFKQINKDECGVMCARFLISKYYKSDKYGCLKLENRCTNFDAISISLSTYGFETQSYKIENLKEFRNGKIITPLIVQIKNEDSFHFIVVVKKIGFLYLCYYPELGYYLKKFDSIFKKDSYILAVEKFTKKDLKKIEFLRPKEKFIVGLISIFELISICVLSFFINYDGYSIYSLCIIPFVLLIFLCHQMVNLNLVSKIDKRFVSNYLAIDSSYQSFYALNKLKTKIIDESNYIFTLIGCFLYILFLFVFSFSAEIINILICLCAGLLVHFIFQIKVKKFEKTIKMKEINVISEYSKEKYLSLVKKSQGVLSYYYLEIFMQILIIVAFNAFIAFKNNYFNFEYLFSNFVCSFAITRYFVSFMSSKENTTNSYQDLTYLDKGVYDIKEIYKESKKQ